MGQDALDSRCQDGHAWVPPEWKCVRADHLATLLLFHDDALIDALAARHLAPLGTVRYRLRRLDEVFGSQLHDPAAQFEMQLVLHALSLRPRRGR